MGLDDELPDVTVVLDDDDDAAAVCFSATPRDDGSGTVRGVGANNWGLDLMGDERSPVILPLLLLLFVGRVGVPLEDDGDDDAAVAAVTAFGEDATRDDDPFAAAAADDGTGVRAKVGLRLVVEEDDAALLFGVFWGEDPLWREGVRGDGFPLLHKCSRVAPGRVSLHTTVVIVDGIINSGDNLPDWQSSSMGAGACIAVAVAADAYDARDVNGNSMSCDERLFCIIAGSAAAWLAIAAAFSSASFLLRFIANSIWSASLILLGT
jgi:hypothetical protein